MRRLFLAVSLAAIVAPVPARALPAFARRFNLACGACHVAVPRLNAYGEAFHVEGYGRHATATAAIIAWPKGTLREPDMRRYPIDRKQGPATARACVERSCLVTVGKSRLCDRPRPRFSA